VLIRRVFLPTARVLATLRSGTKRCCCGPYSRVESTGANRIASGTQGAIQDSMFSGSHHVKKKL
jgi:hypothetical protein